MSGCPGLYYNFVGASSEVSGAIGFAKSTASTAIRGATDAASKLLGFSFTPIDVPRLDIEGIEYPGYQQPSRPSPSSIDSVDESGMPTRPVLSSVDLAGLNTAAPGYDLTTPDIEVPASPTLVAPVKPGAAPTFSPVAVPEYKGGALPTVPTLEELQIPEAPTLNLDEFDVARPEFSAPEEHLYENNLIAETNQLATTYLNNYLQFDPNSQEVRDRWSQMLQGGTGLPAPIEQALFDRALGRDELSSEQAVRQAQGEWAARGFSLPGATLLAREGEIRRSNRSERGRINRELSIQLHQQEIDNLRFAVEQGVRLEGQRFEHYVRIHDAARAVVVGSYEVARQLIAARVDVLNAQLQIYQTDVQAFRESVQIELSRLEAFRSQIEAERVRGEINQQRVALYEAQLRGVVANVDVYRAEIEGINGRIQAQIGEMQVYKERVNAYRAEWDGQRAQVEVYNARVGAEEAKSRIFESQVRAYAERVNAFGAEVNASRAKIDAQSAYNESQVRQYQADVDAWQSKVSARVEKIRAQIAEFQSQVQMYSADIQGEQARSDGHRADAQLAIERSRVDVEGKLKAADQQIEQLRLAETLGLEALRGAAQANSQLAASALSAINASASISDSVTRSNSGTASCTESYVFSGEI